MNTKARKYLFLAILLLTACERANVPIPTTSTPAPTPTPTRQASVALEWTDPGQSMVIPRANPTSTPMVNWSDPLFGDGWIQLSMVSQEIAWDEGTIIFINSGISPVDIYVNPDIQLPDNCQFTDNVRRQIDASLIERDVIVEFFPMQSGVLLIKTQTPGGSINFFINDGGGAYATASLMVLCNGLANGGDFEAATQAANIWLEGYLSGWNQHIFQPEIPIAIINR